MIPTDPRDATWQEIQGCLSGTRETIWYWLLAHGPAGTSAIAEATSIGLLTVRPRVSELVAWGFAECIGREHREGIYRAITISQAQATHEAINEAQTNFKF